jgi:hypothetical protein
LSTPTQVAALRPFQSKSEYHPVCTVGTSRNVTEKATAGRM